MREEDIRLKRWYGCGYHSGARNLYILAYNVNDTEILTAECDEFQLTEVFMGELDGKHSEVIGYELDELDNIIEIIKEYKKADKNMLADITKESKCYLLLKVVDDYLQNLEINTVYKHKITGETLDMRQYKQVEEVVKK